MAGIDSEDERFLFTHSCNGMDQQSLPTSRGAEEKESFNRGYPQMFKQLGMPEVHYQIFNVLHKNMVLNALHVNYNINVLGLNNKRYHHDYHINY